MAESRISIGKHNGNRFSGEVAGRQMIKMTHRTVPRLTRRWLMRASLIASLLPATSRAGPHADGAARLYRALARPDSARRVGRAVMRARGEPHTSRELWAEFAGHQPGLAAAACHQVAPQELRVMLGEACRSDFGRGATVVVDGWLLSRTEALVCALVAAA
ncbi:MAG: hypothetical protein R3349_02235 [Geminicoccaceae bacterium]|nr:hypothetical protein [Geminicoccaceae bacterium]